jgi:UDP-N-acetylglucosamine transferase subunit ALG13/2-polyprenyl-3-methyl-5-hydroxy-6-metoxy-1,4-benzoquinol methylase
MIFVSLGTQNCQFIRLLQELENLIKTFQISDECVVQLGYTSYTSAFFKSFAFVNDVNFSDYIHKADVIVTHAGCGALFNAIKNRKKIIAVARLKKYGEMIDDHQTEIVKKLSEDGHIIDGTDSLINAWKKLENFLPRPFNAPNLVVNNLKQYIDQLYPECPVCSSSMVSISSNYSICKVCHYMSSRLLPGEGMEAEDGLEPVRERNFRHICKIIKKQFPHSKTILDIGSSSGLFLKIACEEGFEVTGLEPTLSLAQETRVNGFNVIDGFFPDAKELSNKVYDILVFNDSIEHIPDIKTVIKAIKEHLNKSNGVVIINLPTSDGIIFKIAFFLNKIGIYKFFDRLWQKNFPSPHLHFFNKYNLELLLKKNNFSLIHSLSFQHYTIKGLWKRVSYRSSLLMSCITWLTMVLCYPIFNKRSNISCCFFSLDEK